MTHSGLQQRRLIAARERGVSVFAPSLVTVLTVLTLVVVWATLVTDLDSTDGASSWQTFSLNYSLAASALSVVTPIASFILGYHLVSRERGWRTLSHNVARNGVARWVVARIAMLICAALVAQAIAATISGTITVAHLSPSPLDATVLGPSALVAVSSASLLMSFVFYGLAGTLMSLCIPHPVVAALVTLSYIVLESTVVKTVSEVAVFLPINSQIGTMSAIVYFHESAVTAPDFSPAAPLGVAFAVFSGWLAAMVLATAAAARLSGARGLG